MLIRWYKKSNSGKNTPYAFWDKLIQKTHQSHINNSYTQRHSISVSKRKKIQGFCQSPVVQASIMSEAEEIEQGALIPHNQDKILWFKKTYWKKLERISKTLYGKAYKYVQVEFDQTAKEYISKHLSLEEQYMGLLSSSSISNTEGSLGMESSSSSSNSISANMLSLQVGVAASTATATATTAEGAKSSSMPFSMSGTFNNDIEMHEVSDRSLAIVIVKKSSLELVHAKTATNGSKIPEDPVMESKILRYLNENPHPFIMKLIAFFKDDFFYFTVVKYYNGGDLIGYLTKTRTELIGEYEASRIMNDVVSAVSHLHSLNIVHLDISPENILLHTFPNGERHAILIDFGTARWFPSSSSDYSLFDIQVGKEKYMAPEMYKATGKVLRGMPCDIWTIGSTLLTMLCGFNIYTFPRAANCQLFNYIAQYGFANYVAARGRQLSQKALNFCVLTMQMNPDARPRVQDLLIHPYLNISESEDRVAGVMQPSGNESQKGSKGSSKKSSGKSSNKKNKGNEMDVDN